MMFKFCRSVLGVVCVYVVWLSGGTSADSPQSCKLLFKNGSEINLMMVAASPQDAPRFKDCKSKNSSDNSLYYYNPCYSYVYPPDGQGMSCSNNVAVCHGTVRGYFNIGTQDSGKFFFDNKTQMWVISYYSRNYEKQTNVSLKCTDSLNHTLEVNGQTQGQDRRIVYDGFLFLVKCGQNDDTYERI
ncbi:uncharacterized protein LOC121876679 isoform X2 [Homarus americanus]|uniref:uncharacterized protein LOC121876679 isoform X2 n=1 Tax=Homarus americanus TaxID=6706 RepID=UPI001C44C171|nr:uncharacterized protein LOC121876679 isoform X2 [Homarus americanus]